MRTKMTTNDFDYVLPDALIAKYPLQKRSDSRLLVLHRATGVIDHTQFTHFVDYLQPEDLVVFNNTKVIAARLWGRKASGGKISCLVERIISKNTVLAHLKSSKSPRIGSLLCFAQAMTAEVLDREGDLFILQFQGSEAVLELLEQYGEVPLPPYLQREAESLDQQRYQTIFASREGAVAAPTAALHFDEEILQKIRNKGVETGFVTLHVGAGTFQPVRVEALEDHVMHKEYLQVPVALCQQIKRCRQRGGRVVAIGTTVVRCLETAAQGGEIAPFEGDTQLFIYPGYQFRCVDVLFTNFHLPRSTLLMLVCAFAEQKTVMAAYGQAIAQSYRFFSYGDAMLVL